MDTKMNISSEMLAAYAEGKVFGAERDAIRKYLADNPSELRTVALMMDEDYDLDVDNDNDLLGKISESASFSTFCCSAAAFAPIQTGSVKKMINAFPKPKDSFETRLKYLMDDLDAIID